MDTFAFAGTAQQMPIGNSSGGRESAPQPIPTNAFRIGWDGAIEEGILLDFDHPTAPMKTALIFGESGRFMAVNSVSSQACALEDVGNRHIAKRIRLHKIEPAERRPFFVLNKLERPSAYVLVHADFGTPSGVAVKKPLWAGIAGDNTVVSWGGNEALVLLDEEQGDLRIFYADGRVGVVSYSMFGASQKLVFFDTPEDILVVRLDLVEQKLYQAGEIVEPDKRARAVDRWFHELATMLFFSGTSPQMRRQIMSKIEHLSANYSPSNGVRMRIKEVLLGFGDRTIYGFLFGKSSADEATLDRAAPARKGPPREATARKAVRSQRDQQERNTMRGPVRQDDSKVGAGKKGGKK